MGDRKGTYRISTEKWGKEYSGRSRYRCEDNIKMHLQKVGWEIMGWIGPVQDTDGWQALVKAVTNLRVP